MAITHVLCGSLRVTRLLFRYIHIELQETNALFLQAFPQVRQIVHQNSAGRLCFSLQPRREPVVFETHFQPQGSQSGGMQTQSQPTPSIGRNMDGSSHPLD
jgi:hypothetical protein